MLDAYQDARGPFSDDELAEAWAAGLWNRSFDAKKQSTEGGPKSLTEADAVERRCRFRGLRIVLCASMSVPEYRCRELMRSPIAGSAARVDAFTDRG